MLEHLNTQLLRCPRSNHEDLLQWINIYFLSTFIVTCYTGGMVHWTQWTCPYIDLDEWWHKCGVWMAASLPGPIQFVMDFCSNTVAILSFSSDPPSLSAKFSIFNKRSMKALLWCEAIIHCRLPSQCGHSAIYRLSTISTSHLHHTWRNIHGNKL